MPEFEEYVERMRVTHPQLANDLAEVVTLQRLLGWMTERGFDLAAIDLVQQDEFCFDMLVPWGGKGEWLDFGMG